MTHYVLTLPGNHEPDPEIIVDKPPNYDQINEAFTLSGEEIFAWDGTIYSPSEDIPQWLIEHEKVHFKQQDGDPESWWDMYINDSGFRLSQEIPAHKKEYEVFCKLVKDRNKQFSKRLELAQRLASPMYGNMTTTNEAMKHFRS